MSTARVHTVLAALTAEKQALLAKLNHLDAALEANSKKKRSKRTDPAIPVRMLKKV
jgi:hypothetical protein